MMEEEPAPNLGVPGIKSSQIINPVPGTRWKKQLQIFISMFCLSCGFLQEIYFIVDGS
jgi:hypothetical protein